MVGLSHPAQARGGRLEVGEGAETESPRGSAMDGRRFREPERALGRRIEQRQKHSQAERFAYDEKFFEILQELDRGEWRLRHWARELGVSEDEMLIELDRHLHHHRAA